MPDICVDTEKVADCGRRVQGFSGRSSQLNGMAGAASVPELAWGALGNLVGLYSYYDELLQELQSHFDKMSEGFDKIGTKLRDTAQAYREADDTSAEHLAQFLREPHAGKFGGGSHGQAPSNLGALGASYSNQWSASNMSGNLLTQSAKSIPVVNGSYSLIKDSMQLGNDMKSGDGVAIGKDVTSVLSDMNTYVQDGLAVAGAIADPLNFLISKGLGWLLHVVAPLKQAVDLVSGDPDGTSMAATRFDDIAHQAEQLAKSYDDQLRVGLQSWSGEAGDAAAKKLSEFHDGIEGTAHLAGHVASILQGSSMVMKAAEDIMKGILSDLVEWLVVTWVAAQLAAPATGGGSEGGAAVLTIGEEAAATSRATSEINKVRQLLDKIMSVLARLRQVLTKSGNKFKENLAEAKEEGRYAKSAVESIKGSAEKYGLQAVGISKSDRPELNMASTPYRNQYVDPVKTAGAVGGHVDNFKKVAQYENEGNEQDGASTERDLDV